MTVLRRQMLHQADKHQTLNIKRERKLDIFGSKFAARDSASDILVRKNFLF